MAWARYESAVAEPTARACPICRQTSWTSSCAGYRLQGHYLAAGCFLDEAQFLAGCSALAGLPVTLIHGCDDRVCPPANAERLHAAIPAAGCCGLMAADIRPSTRRW